MKYANLHGRSTFSTGSAVGTSDDIIRRAKAIGLHAVGITDTSTISGVLDAYRTAGTEKFPVCIGTEVWYFDDIHDKGQKFTSLILLAKNQNGYRNLCKLTSLSNLENRRTEAGPRLSIEDIKEHSQDLICLTSNINGPFSKGYIDCERKVALEKGIKRIKVLQSIFKDDLYMEVVLNNEIVNDINVQAVANKDLIAVAKGLNIPLVIASDSYMVDKGQKVLQDIVLSNSYSKTALLETRWLMSVDEMWQKALVDHPYIGELAFIDMCNNSIKAADKCKDIQLSFKPQIVSYPHLMHSLGKSNQTKLELLMEIVKESGRVDFKNPIYKERLEYEIKAICHNGKIDLIDYFLVLEDLCRWCRDNGIIVGPGRGSGAGSLLNYGLRITHLDPIKYGLLFERFISEGRIQKGTLPDVDLDFSDQERVRNYLVEKYGTERVKSIGVMQTLRLKNAFKDAFKALHPEVDFFTVNAASTVLPKQEQGETEQEYYARSLEECDAFKKILEKYKDVKEAVGSLIGFNRQPGVHPCGLAISQDPLDDFVPLRLLKDKWVLEFNADDAALAGIIKYDILGLTTLKYFGTCLDLIKQRHGIDVDIYEIPLDDPKTLENFMKGDTESVFQFNSDVSISILTNIEVRSVDDLSLVTSVGRPGPMVNNQHNEFIKRKNGEVAPNPPHPALSEILADSYGIMIYQESVMKAAQILGGFSLAEADDIRKAMGKKDAKYIDPYKERFVANASKNFTDISPQRAAEIWHLMETFSGYGFNKSHSMSYALVGYLCQYFKTHYAQEWWTACLKNATDTEHVSAYYSACKHLVNLPSINKSTNDYFIGEDGKIQMPLSCIKGIGDAANGEIESKRPFSSLEDFYERVTKSRVNKKVVSQLIFSGAFEEFGHSKGSLVDTYYKLRKEKLPPELVDVVANKSSAIKKLEADALNFIVPNYYEIFEEKFEPGEFKKFSEFRRGIHDNPNKQVIWVIGGVIDDIKENLIKKGKSAGQTMKKVVVCNCGESMKVTLWPEEAKLYAEEVKIGKIVKIRGKLDFYQDRPQLTCISIQTLE